MASVTPHSLGQKCPIDHSRNPAIISYFCFRAAESNLVVGSGIWWLDQLDQVWASPACFEAAILISNRQDVASHGTFELVESFVIMGH
jgi:hypothetical protein